MKRLLILLLLSFLIFTPTYAAELTTEAPATTTEETTEEASATTVLTTTEIPIVEESEDGLLGFFENITFDKIMQIIQWLTLIFGFFIVLRQRVEVAIAEFKKKQAEEKLAQTETAETTLLTSFVSLFQVLNIIVQTSKLSTEDKLLVANTITTEQTRISNVVNTLTNIADIAKTEGTNVLQAATDLLGVVTAGATALKTGNLESVLSKYKKTGE